MPMTFRCTACTARLHVPKRWAGTTIECPKCATRVVVPLEPPESQPVRFEERSLERRIEAFEEATAAAVHAAAAMATGSSPAEGPSSMAWTASNDRSAKGPRMDRGAAGRRMIAVPSFWIPLLVAGVLVAIAASAAAGFWAGWLASQPVAK